MSEIDQAQQQARIVRTNRREAEETLYRRRNRLLYKQNQLAQAQRSGPAGANIVGTLKQEIDRLKRQIVTDRERLDDARIDLFRVLDRYGLWQRPWELVEQLPDHLPFLLLPVRMEYRFMPLHKPPEERTELWVRIFPDDIAVHTHEAILTPDEVSAGRTHWQTMWAAAQESDPDERKKQEKGSWRVLVEEHGDTRAAWIAIQSEPESLEVPSVDALVFPEFAPEELKSESWSRAPRTYVMPDRFAVMLYSGDDRLHRELGNPIPDPLVLGPDPLNEEPDLNQEEDELAVKDDLAWMFDFEGAVTAGLGMRIDLTQIDGYDGDGFDRLVVLGLRLSSNPDENQALLEELFENHRYAPDGLSLLPQGTATNNTGRKKAGYSSTGLSAEESFELMKDDPLFKTDDNPFAKYDAQRLAEALGIDHQLFQRVPSADQQDVAEAMAMNRALWPGTLGYYLEEMLELSLETVDQVRDFFVHHVTGRGPLPAIRVGTQPYGILLTSDFSRWKWFLQEEDPNDLPFLNKLYEALQWAEITWRQKSAEVPHVGPGGVSYQDLLSMLGLQAASTEYYRRHAAGQLYLGNSMIMKGDFFSAWNALKKMAQQARQLLRELGHPGEEPPRLFDLALLTEDDLILDPRVDDIPPDQTEKLSETRELKKVYFVPGLDNPTNYIGWLWHADFDDLKRQRFKNEDDEVLPTPSPLLYRMLRGALLQATYDASMRLYVSLGVLSSDVRREVELSNIRVDGNVQYGDRTVTRWEFMEADVSWDRLGLSDERQRMADYLRQTGLGRPEARHLQQVRESLKQLIPLRTARLERLLAEHIDLGTYRLDAWQMGMFQRRLHQQRYPYGEEAFENRGQGIYLGAFGWLEEVRPNPTTSLSADLTGIPDSLHESGTDGPLIEQPDNFGFIHGPSLNHAVTAAVLRNAYLSHRDSDEPDKMAINLSSERVRTALSILEGIRNGQELGALLGYQFERGLHDRYGGRMNQYIPHIRQKYPLVVDKITPDEDGESIESKEARNVFDGYALLEKAVLKDSPLDYPYGIDEGLPIVRDHPHAQAIIAEVNRMADTLEAVADLDLAEGVYQVTQGNYDRAGGIMKSLGEGGYPAEPEIANTPRSGTPINQRVTLHLETDVATTAVWPGSVGERALAEPGLNQWLGDRLPPPDKIGYTVAVNDNPPQKENLESLGLQPIDLIYMINDELTDETSELEKRIAFAKRQALHDDTVEVHLGFMGPLDDGVVPLFELLPLLRELRTLVADSRPLAATDYTLPGETTTNPDENPQGYDVSELEGRMDNAIERFSTAFDALEESVPNHEADEGPNPDLADAESLRTALRDLASFGLPDAFPRSAVGDSDSARATLLAQAVNTREVAKSRREAAKLLKEEGDDGDLAAAKRVESYRAAARQIYGPAFNLLPRFDLKNISEVQAAVTFRDMPRDASLTRFHQDNPLLVNEWLQGLSPVREKMAGLEKVQLLAEAFTDNTFQLKPLQLPYRETDHWVAVAYPEVTLEDLDEPDIFQPEGEFLSIVQALPGANFVPDKSHSGLMIDEWTEVIPNKQETTGLAVHFNQPNSEPPQTLLLCVTPEVTGKWAWEKLERILIDTLERAKQRAVEPDMLGDTPYGHLLPAIVAAVTSYPYATISTDFIHQTNIAAMDLVEE